jgi:hypothetical protein
MPSSLGWQMEMLASLLTRFQPLIDYCVLLRTLSNLERKYRAVIIAPVQPLSWTALDLPFTANRQAGRRGVEQGGKGDGLRGTGVFFIILPLSSPDRIVVFNGSHWYPSTTNDVLNETMILSSREHRSLARA